MEKTKVQTKAADSTGTGSWETAHWKEKTFRDENDFPPPSQPEAEGAAGRAEESSRNRLQQSLPSPAPPQVSKDQSRPKHISQTALAVAAAGTGSTEICYPENPKHKLERKHRAEGPFSCENWGLMLCRLHLLEPTLNHQTILNIYNECNSCTSGTKLSLLFL